MGVPRAAPLQGVSGGLEVAGVSTDRLVEPSAVNRQHADALADQPGADATGICQVHQGGFGERGHREGGQAGLDLRVRIGTSEVEARLLLDERGDHAGRQLTDHEHVCISCPMLRVDPRARPRLAAIIADLRDRIDEARASGWLGELQGLQISLDATASNLAALDRASSRGNQVIAPSAPMRPLPLASTQ